MCTSLQERQRRDWESHLKTKYAQWEALSEQLETELDAGDRVLIRKKLERVEEEIEELDDELNRIGDATGRGTAPPAAPPNADTIRNRLPKIDFDHVIKLMQQLVDGPEDACACVMLFQQSLQMGGQLCGERIREVLAEATADLKYWEVEFHASGGLDQRALLDGLAAYLNVDAHDDLNQYAADVIRTICGSLQSGSIVMMEFRSWDYVQPVEPVIDWFLGFWGELVQHLKATSADFLRIRLFATIFANGNVSADCLTDQRICTADALDQQRILKMDLEKWTEEQIRRWLTRYAQKPRNTIEQIYADVWGASQGLPLAVEHAILNALGT